MEIDDYLKREAFILTCSLRNMTREEIQELKEQLNSAASILVSINNWNAADTIRALVNLINTYLSGNSY